ncbi:hypothetical protein AOQ84DRAFT_422955 [Glonium stellatum]|uniref:Uncharacterized protein n=1 Tax=Glonium stellatum TaxID=574774 RepID=A0A8E2JM39_9PEZI|nr:hypothetical protein AOQ84DRAFT_422955 [Glonium stellatum]
MGEKDIRNNPVGTVRLIDHNKTVLIPTTSLDPRVSVTSILLTFSIGAIFINVSASYGFSPQASDLMAYPTLFMGIRNLIGMLIAMAIGRRPVFLASALILFSAIQSIGTASLVIATTYLTAHLGWKWWYTIFAIVNGAVLILVELDFTNYKARTIKHYLKIFHVLMNSAVLGVYVVMITEFAIIFSAPPYNYPFDSLGFVQAGQIVVSITMMPLLGYGGDFLIRALARRNAGIAEPEHRLILIMLPAAVVIISYAIFGMAGSHPTQWSSWAVVVSYDAEYFGFIGIVLLGFTYLLDSYGKRAALILVLTCAIRGLVSFSISFRVTNFVKLEGYQGALKVCAIAIEVISAFSFPVYFFGRRIRKVTIKYAINNESVHI